MKKDCNRKNSVSEWAHIQPPLKGQVDPQAAALAIMKTVFLWICVLES